MTKKYNWSMQMVSHITSTNTLPCVVTLEGNRLTVGYNHPLTRKRHGNFALPYFRNDVKAILMTLHDPSRPADRSKIGLWEIKEVENIVVTKIYNKRPIPTYPEWIKIRYSFDFKPEKCHWRAVSPKYMRFKAMFPGNGIEL
jgi:hypothetical protein